MLTTSLVQINRIYFRGQSHILCLDWILFHFPQNVRGHISKADYHQETRKISKINMFLVLVLELKFE